MGIVKYLKGVFAQVADGFAEMGVEYEKDRLVEHLIWARKGYVFAMHDSDESDFLSLFKSQQDDCAFFEQGPHDEEVVRSFIQTIEKRLRELGVDPETVLQDPAYKDGRFLDMA